MSWPCYAKYIVHSIRAKAQAVGRYGKTDAEIIADPVGNEIPIDEIRIPLGYEMTKAWTGIHGHKGFQVKGSTHINEVFGSGKQFTAGARKAFTMFNPPSAILHPEAYDFITEPLRPFYNKIVKCQTTLNAVVKAIEKDLYPDFEYEAFTNAMKEAGVKNVKPLDALESGYARSVLEHRSSGKAGEPKSPKEYLIGAVRGQAPDAQALFVEQHGEEFKKIVEKLKGLAMLDPSPEADEAYKALGLDRSHMAEAIEWTAWLAKGGPFERANPTWVTKLMSNYSSAQSRLNMTWAMYNLGDFQRVASAYMHKPQALIAGIKQTFDPKAMLELPDGLIDELAHGWKYDPFNMSNVLITRFAYYTDRAAGGNGRKAVADLVYALEPWDMPQGIRAIPVESRPMVYGLGRFMIADFNWYKLQVAKLFDKKLSPSQRQEEAFKLASYHMTKALLFGGTAAMPNVLWEILPNDTKKFIQEKIPFEGVIPMAVNPALEEVAGLKVSPEAFQAQQLPGLGARFSALTNSLKTVVAALPKKSLEAASAGDMEAIKYYGLAEGLAIMNLTGTPLPWNGTTTTRLLGEFGNAQLEGKEGQEYWHDALKTVLGSNTFKSAYGDE